MNRIITSLSLVAISLGLSTGCENAVDELLTDNDKFLNFACTHIPYDLADCTDTAVQNELRSILVRGSHKASIRCNGVATTPAGKFIRVKYDAVRLLDGSCDATVALSDAVSITSNGHTWFGRDEAASDVCRVTSYHGTAMFVNVTSVDNGVVSVESPVCIGGGHTKCTMSVATSCTGDVSEF